MGYANPSARERECVGDRPCVRDRVTVIGNFAEQLLDQPRVAGIILDEQNPGHVALSGGSFTIVNQKSSIDFTTVMNCSRSTGFVM